MFTDQRYSEPTCLTPPGLTFTQPTQPTQQIVDNRPDHLAIPEGRQHREMIQEYAAKHAGAISDMFVRMPRPLLLLLKTNGERRRMDGSLTAC